MRAKRYRIEDPKIQRAAAELKHMVLEKYPSATFSMARGEEPEGIFLTATIDIDDTTEVIELVADRLVDIQVEEDLPLYMMIVRPLERVLRELHATPRARPEADLGATL